MAAGAAGAVGIPTEMLVAQAAKAANKANRLPAPRNVPIDHFVLLMMENRSFDHMLKWHEEMILDGVPEPGEGLAIPHELTDFQKDFLGAKADLLAARRQLDAAGKAVF